MKSRKSLTRAWLWVSSAAALERCACCRLQMDRGMRSVGASGVWEASGRGLTRFGGGR